jgi:hypothetical protein
VAFDDYGLNAAREYINATTDKTSRHPKVFVHKGLNSFKYEIEHYTWDFYARGEMKGLSKDRPLKRNDHLMNSFQYLCCLHPKAHKSRETPRDNAGKQEYARLNSYT